VAAAKARERKKLEGLYRYVARTAVSKREFFPYTLTTPRARTIVVEPMKAGFYIEVS
jgi:hypothetical protein